MLAQISFTPVGIGEETKELLAKAAKIVAQSELDYQFTSMGIIIEGDWDDVTTITRKCHEEIRKFSDRLVTNIRIDDRKGLGNRLKNNVLEVEYAVGDSLQTNGLT